MLNVLMDLATRLLFSLAGEKVGDINQQSARQFPSWALFGFLALFVAATAFGIAVLASQTIQLLAT